jgi:hypothetical protein
MPEANHRICCRCSKRKQEMRAISDAVDSELFGSAEFAMHIFELIEMFRSVPPALRVQIRRIFESSDETS